jgi:alanyl-tRNA synthetase
VNGKLVESADASRSPVAVEVVLDRTPFYANGGGQAGDRGRLTSPGAVVVVGDTQKTDVYYFHRGELKSGALRVGDVVDARVDAASRLSTERHHTATHLLHLALKKILGAHVNQAGSLVDRERLRFDFTHGGKVTPEQIQQIEDFVNERILRAEDVSKKEMTLAEARESGAVMLFGEKYGDRVRVLAACDSVELCGGTHVGNTGNIGVFKIVSEASAAAGIRRIEAVCGPLVLELLRERESVLSDIASELKSPPAGAVERIRQLRAEVKQAKETRARASGMDAKEAATRLRDGFVRIRDGVAAVVVLGGFPASDLKSLVDDARKSAPDHVIVLLCPSEESVAFVVAVAGAPAKRFKAGDIAKQLGPAVGGGGGGRPDFAQGQGKNVHGTADAVSIAKRLLEIDLGP